MRKKTTREKGSKEADKIEPVEIKKNIEADEIVQ